MAVPGPARDLVGYGRNRPTGEWPGGARLAVNVVINYEEGSERSLAAGDPDQETSTEWGSYPFGEERNLAMETMYEYGSRVGIWRILEQLDRFDADATFFACAVAVEANPELAAAIAQSRHDVVCHGYRWEEVFRLSEAEEREHMRMAVSSLTTSLGRRPLGWYCRYGPSVRTRRLVVEEGGFLFDCDAYNDDVPYYVTVGDRRHLVVPYSPDTNDFRFWQQSGPATAAQFFEYLCDAFDFLYQESRDHLKLMSVGLHPRIIGRPGRIVSLTRFLDYVQGKKEAAILTRTELARWWLQHHPAEDGP
jgi:peptidoglycan/xylan/chitin deacetylase (PgdA/CDA1 family)